MKQIIVLLSFILVNIGCKKPFSQSPETALALPLEKKPTNGSVVFIAGFDEGTNAYYTKAKQYFEGQGIQVIDSLFSLNEILTYINHQAENRIHFDEIHIVSHSNAWLGMSLKTIRNGERITLKTLQKTRAENQIKDVQNGITNDTKIIFHSCGLGENQALLQELKDTFTTTKAPKVYASTFFNVFGGKFAGHYLAKPYYTFYPTAESKGPAHLAKEFKSTYPQTQIDWFTAIKTRRETSLGEAYSFKFNIPVNWEFKFDNFSDIPVLKDKDAIMDWVSESQEMAEVLFELNIPIEKYRWKTEVRGRKLMIKGKTTVLCVLAPILQDRGKGEYQKPRVEDPNLYQIL
ncbi:hypothetical protein FEE95_08970 [Maribacter algarum]|uniref:DUF4347 domain-containing protein n=1 Tax=Maribacter algarum (ex Zhang et al. 2020) TaxID=2578118 RepID=A0A5S3PPF0_9FLAO|nr:hypothetical protein [Maribacter algarum]TMM56627.1 hypothetical protein FEE95_08970 [Maribacter algarum]